MHGKSPLIKHFLHYLKVEKGLSTNTIQSYALDLARLQEWASNRSIRSLTEREVERWLGDLSRVNLNASSIARALSTTRSFFQFLILDNHIDIDPTQILIAPKKTQRLPTTLTTEEVDRLLAAPDITTREGLRDRALIELMYATGLRVSEAISLTHADLNLRSGVLRCQGKGNKERQVPIGKQALNWVAQHLSNNFSHRPPRTSRVFLNQGAPLTRQFTWAMISTYATRAGLRDVTPHTLRHSFATHLLQNGASTTHVQLLLGHTHFSTTATYTHITPRHKRKSYDQHHPRARAKKLGFEE